MTNAQQTSDAQVVREVFTDGNMNDVIRHGDIVMRRLGHWSAASHAVLRHLEAVRFQGAPRLLRMEGDYEVLTFVDGSSAPADLAGFSGDQVLVAIAELVRQLHDALSSFHPDSHLDFPRMPGAPEGSGFVCHNDLAPWNTIFQRQRPLAFIDWDLVAPAPRAWDLAYAAWRFVPLYPDDARYGDAWTRGRRLRLFLDTYGLRSDERGEFIEIVRRRQVSAYETVEQWGTAGMPGFARLYEQRLHVSALDDIAWLDANASTLLRAIM